MKILKSFVMLFGYLGLFVLLHSCSLSEPATKSDVAGEKSDAYTFIQTGEEDSTIGMNTGRLKENQKVELGQELMNPENKPEACLSSNVSAGNTNARNTAVALRAACTAQTDSTHAFKAGNGVCKNTGKSCSQKQKRTARKNEYIQKVSWFVNPSIRPVYRKPRYCTNESRT